jgi:hypothetical protein
MLTEQQTTLVLCFLLCVALIVIWESVRGFWRWLVRRAAAAPSPAAPKAATSREVAPLPAAASREAVIEQVQEPALHDAAPPAERADDDAAVCEPRVVAGVIVLALALGIATALLSASGPGGSGSSATPALGVWHSAAAGRYQYHRFAAGIAPVIECIHYDQVALLHEAILGPIPDLTPEARIEPSVARQEELERARQRDLRAQAARRCVMDEQQVTAVELLIDSRWSGKPQKGHLPAPAILVMRDGTRYFRALAVQANGTLAPRLVNEQDVLVAAVEWVQLLREKETQRHLKALYDPCLCLAHYGLLQTGVHLYFDRKTPSPAGAAWRVWYQPRAVRWLPPVPPERDYVPDVAANFSVTDIMWLPYALVARVLGDPHVVEHWEFPVVAHVDLGRTWDTPGGDVYLDAIEPQWLLAAASGAEGDDAPVSPLAAVVDVRKQPSGEMALSSYEAGCLAHCAAMERAMLG